MPQCFRKRIKPVYPGQAKIYAVGREAKAESLLMEKRGAILGARRVNDFKYFGKRMSHCAAVSACQTSVICSDFFTIIMASDEALPAQRIPSQFLSSTLSPYFGRTLKLPHHA